MLKMGSIGLKTNELLTYHCGCHGNLVTMQQGMLLMPIVLRKLYTKNGLNRT